MKKHPRFKSSYMLELVCTTNFNSVIRSSFELYCSLFELSHFHSLMLSSVFKKLEPGEYPIDIKFNVTNIDVIKKGGVLKHG